MDYKKKVMSLFLSAVMLSSSLFTVAYAESDSKEIAMNVSATNSKIQLELFSKDFTKLSIEKQLTTISEYYLYHGRVYDAYSKQVNTEKNISTLYEMKEQLIKNDRNENRINELIYTLTSKNKNVGREKLENLKKITIDIVNNQKETRKKGRSLEDKIIARTNLINFSRLLGLEQVATSYEAEQHFKKAIEVYNEVLFLNNGKTETIEKISDLSKKNNSPVPVFIENKAYDISKYIKTINGTSYIATKSLQEIEGFKVDWDSNTKSVIIKHRENIFKLPIDKYKIYLNDVVVDSGKYLLTEDGVSYIPLRSMFEILSYTVNWNNKADTIVISRTSYRETEIDKMQTSEIVRNLWK